MANSYEIKSAQLPLVALLLKTAELKQVGQDLLQEFGPQSDSSDFFDNDALVLDFSKVDSPLSARELGDLIQALRSCRLKPIAFRGATPAIANLARSLDLIEAPNSAPSHKEAAVVKEVKPAPVVHEVVREVPAPGALVVDKPLRSGQKIYARGCDLVVLAMVNQGAEVFADGNIHVYAPLRGKAMAGASGNAKARIFSLCFEPELISIAGIYRTSEHSLPSSIQGKPAQVRLSDDGQEKLLFEALNA